MGFLSSLFGSDPDYTQGDYGRRQWKPLDPRPLYDWETVTADGRIVTKDVAAQEATKDIMKRAVDKSAFPGTLPPEAQPKPKTNLFDRILTGINTGQSQ
jgi:hypothetical protein